MQSSTRKRAHCPDVTSSGRSPPPGRWPLEPSPPRRNQQQVRPRRRARSPLRRAISVRTARRPPISPTPTSSPSIRASTACAQPNAPIQRLWTGALWSEGPAWNAQGRYLVWSDIPNNRQLRWLEDDGRVSVFRMPSNNSNGNTFDFQGRQLVLRAPDAARRPLRARRLGHRHRRRLQRQAAQLAERRGAASRRQLLVHRSALWRPALRRRARRGGRAEQCGGPAQTRARPAAGIGQAKRELPTNCYRVDPERPRRPGRHRGPGARSRTASASRPTTRSSTSSAPARVPGDTGPGGKGDMYVFDVGADNKLSNQQAVHRLHGRRRQVRPGRRALRRRRQSLGARATPAAQSATAA